MKSLYRKKSGDENIGKLIMFSITIIVAVGLVGLITYFYNLSKNETLASSILGNSRSHTGEISTIVERFTGINACTGATNFKYNVMTNSYTIEFSNEKDTHWYNINGTEKESDKCAGEDGLGNIFFNKILKDINDGDKKVTYKMK